MNYILIAVLILLMIMVVVSLVRGVVAFLRSTREDLERGGEGSGASEMQLQQNRMMFARIKYQALAIVVVGLLIMVSR